MQSLRNLRGFGLALLGARCLDYVQGNADNVLVGRYLGSAALGLYSVAYNVILLPQARIFIPIQDVLFPALSRIQDDRKRMALLWLRIVRVVGAVVAPSMLGIIVVVPDFVNVVFGQKWAGCVRVAQILALVTLMTGFTALGERTLMALGRAKLLLRVSALRTALSVAAFAAGIHWGIVGIAAFYAASAIPVQTYLVLTATRELDIRRSVFARNLAGVAQASAAMFVSCWAGRALMVSFGVPPAIRLVAVVILGAATYVSAIIWRDPHVVREATRLVPTLGRFRFRRSAGRV